MKKQLLTLSLFIFVFFCSAQQHSKDLNAPASLGKTINSSGIKPIGIDAMNWSKDPFDLKAFIENKGQFDKKDQATAESSEQKVEGINTSNVERIQYAMVNKGAQFYFTSKGWTYRHDETRELKEDEIITEERSYAAAVKDGDRDKEHVRTKTISSFLQMTWEGANANAKIVAENQVAPYFTYPDMNDKSGASCIKALGYSKITYLNLYPGIDVEYTFPDNKRGVEYALILHPGADLSAVKMHYSTTSDLSIDGQGNILIPTAFGDFTDHAPVSYFKDGKHVKSGFEVSGNTVSFYIDESQISNLKSQTLIIDPWTTNPGSVYTTYDAAYDLDHDNAGNVYVYGGGYPWQEIKFNNAGVIQWSYTASLFYDGGCDISIYTLSSACYGDFAVDANSGSSYIVEAFNGGAGARVIKLNNAGSQVGTYNPPNDNLSEMWRVQFNNCTEEAIIAGGGISQSYQACLLDTNVTNMTPINVLNATDALHDFTLLSIDNYGNCFMATAQRYANDGFFDNVLVKCPSSTLLPVNYIVSDNHTFVEVNSVSYVEGATSQANGFNGMAVDNNYVYTYDGNNLKKWNKSNGTLKSSTTSGGTMFASGGLDVNGCGDIFLGIGSFIYQVDSAYNTINIYSAPGNVYDLAISGTTLYACGDGFVGTVTIPSTSCGSLNLQATTTSDSCASKGTATVTVSGGVGPYTYLWSPSGNTTSSITNVAAGSYTITVTDLAFSPCNNATGGTQTLVVVVPSSSANVTVSPSTSICLGKSTTLTAGGASNYTWAPITGLSGTTGPTESASPPGTTTYTVTGSNGGGCTGTATVTVTVNPLPTITVSPSSPSICNGKSVMLSGVGGTSYSWAGGVSGTTGTTVTVSPITTTTYTITGTNANGCTNTNTVTVTVNPLPTIGVSTPPALCSGQSTALIASGGTSYAWSPGGGLSSTTGSTVSANPGSTTTYTITGTDANGCSNTKTVTVTVNPLPTITVSPPSAILCNGQPVSLTASGGTSYTWGPSGGLSATTGATVSANPVTTTTYTVTGTDANGCTNTKTVTVTINGLPVITVGPSAPILCSGQSVSLNAGGGTSYAWSPGGGLSSTTGSTVSANPGSTTTYTVTGTDANGCSNTKTVTVTINPLPVITASPPTTTLCNGQSVALTAGGGTSYVWSPGGGLSSTTGSTVSASPASTTTYTVTGTDANGCSNTKSVTVTVNPLPTITISPVSPILCNGQSVTLTAGGGTSYVWSPSGGLSATTGSSVIANPGNTTSYTVTGTDANSCSNSKSVTITINPPPTITINPVAPILCLGQSVLLTAGGGTSYIWSPGSGLSSTTGSTVSANPGSTTTYTVTGSDANGCTNTKSITVTINPLPTITASPANPVFCVGGSVSLTTGGGTSYVWSPGGGLSSTTGSTVSASPGSTTSYTVTGTDANGCSNTKSVTVTVNPLPTINVIPVSPIICNGQSVSLTASGGASYVWSPSGGLSVTTGATVTASPGSTTIYTVTGTDANGCSNTKSATVNVNPPPVITASPASTILCNGQSVLLTAGGGTSYVWSPSNGLSSVTGSVVSANPSNTTSYTVTGTDANGCSNTQSVTVTINPLPTITVSPPSPSLCNGASVALTAGGGTSYVWSPGTALSATTGSTVTASPSSTTSYTVTGTDANGCIGTASVTVSVISAPVVTVSPATPILCNGQSANLTAGGANTYSWSPSTGLSSSTGGTVAANPSVTTTYTVTGTIAGGCTASKSVTVTVNPLPVITAAPPTSVICKGNSVTITAGGGNTYAWTPVSGLSSGSGSVVSANPSSTTIYTVTGTDANGCSNTATATVTVNPLPVITASPATPQICKGQSVSLTAGGGNTYIWSPANGLSSTTGTTVSANPSGTTTYNITGTDVNGCVNSASVTVTVNPLPVITAAPSAPVLCNGQSVAITASGGVSYTWSPTSGLSSGSGTTVTAGPSTTTTYIVTGSDANGCTNTASVIVTVNQLPVITANPSSSILCNGQSVTIIATGGISYDWFPATGLSSVSGGTVIASPTTTTSYTVTGADANGCVSTARVAVTVNPLPVVTVGTPAAICNGQSTTLTGSGANSYSWSPALGLSSGTGTTVTANPSSTSTYKVIGTDANGCNDTTTVIVNVNPLPAVNAGQDANICPGASAQLNVTGPPPGSSYTWSPSTNLSCNSCSNPSANPANTTTYVVSVKDSAGCSNSDTVNVIVTPLAATAGPDTSVCSGNSVPLHAGGGKNYSWTPATGLDSANTANPTATVLTTTTYTVTVSSGNCSSEVAVTIIVFPDVVTPKITQKNDSLYCTTNPAYKSYQWYYNDTIIPNATNTSYIAPQSGNYNVAVTDTNGCFISVGINIVITGVFSPNSLDKTITVYPNPASSQLFIHGYGEAEKAIVTIYNVLGEKVMEERIRQDNHTSIDIENISAGVYFIEVQQRQNTWVGKFVKE